MLVQKVLPLLARLLQLRASLDLVINSKKTFVYAKPLVIRLGVFTFNLENNLSTLDFTSGGDILGNPFVSPNYAVMPNGYIS